MSRKFAYSDLPLYKAAEAKYTIWAAKQEVIVQKFIS